MARIGLVLVVLGAWAAMQLLQRSTASDRPVQARPGDIQMIASVDCRYCADARDWFGARGLPFSECLIERDAACAAAYRALNAPGTPVLLVRGQRLVGFDSRTVADALR